MRTLTADELAIELTRVFAAELRVGCPTIPDAVLDDLTEQLLTAFTRVADAAAAAERRRHRPGAWS